MSSNPKISIIVIYNSNTGLEECLDTIVNQSFSNIEILCINNSSKDDAQNIVKEFSSTDKRIKLIDLPIENDSDYAKKIGLGIAGGDFVIFIDEIKPIDKDLIKNLYLETVTKPKNTLKSNHLYRAGFLENIEEVSDIITYKVQDEVKKLCSSLEAEKLSFHKEWDNFYKINNENIENKLYTILCRFNQLESLFYEREEKIRGNAYKFEVEQKNHTDEEIHKVYQDIEKVYDYIKSEINLKGADINNVYESITKNNEYINQIIENRIQSVYNAIDTIQNPAIDKIEELEKEMVTRYVNLKRIIDVQIDELKARMQAIATGQPIENSDNNTIYRENNIDNLYSQINNLSSVFYEEISKLYKEFNARLNNEKEEFQYNLEQKINEIRNEVQK